MKSSPPNSAKTIPEDIKRTSSDIFNEPREERQIFAAPLGNYEILHTRSTGTSSEKKDAGYPDVLSFGFLQNDIPARASRLEWLTANHAAATTSFSDAMQGMNAVSCDVFDTLLLRHNKSEVERNLEICEYTISTLNTPEFSQYLSKIDPKALLIMRSMAMKLSYGSRKDIAGCREGSIIEVVTNVARTLGGGDDLAQALLQCELDYESAKCLFANLPLIEALQRFHDRGGRVILISDMYLHGDHIHALIDAVAPGALDCIDEIYSSADTILSKRSGMLFPYIVDRNALSPARTLHIGDSFTSDVQKAREAGINGLLFPIGRIETRMRQLSLRKIVEEFDDIGVDVREWAKI